MMNGEKMKLCYIHRTQNSLVTKHPSTQTKKLDGEKNMQKHTPLESRYAEPRKQCAQWQLFPICATQLASPVSPPHGAHWERSIR